MIRIRTIFAPADEEITYRVFTLYHGGEWVTFASTLTAVGTTSLLEAGQNHLAAALKLRDKLNAKHKGHLGSNEDSTSQDQEKEVNSQTESGL